jgi:hypothetical protein
VVPEEILAACDGKAGPAIVLVDVLHWHNRWSAMKRPPAVVRHGRVWVTREPMWICSRYQYTNQPEACGWFRFLTVDKRFLDRIEAKYPTWMDGHRRLSSGVSPCYAPNWDVLNAAGVTAEIVP